MQIKLDANRINELILQSGFKPQQIIFGTGVLIALIASIPSLQEHAKVQRERREELGLIDRQLEKVENEEKIANELYKSCIPVVGEVYRNSTHYFISLSQGDKPIDRISGKPFSKGVKVCDATGSVGTIGENGAITETYFTGDRDVIQSRLKRFRGSQFSQPVLTNNQQGVN